MCVRSCLIGLAFFVSGFAGCTSKSSTPRYKDLFVAFTKLDIEPTDLDQGFPLFIVDEKGDPKTGADLWLETEPERTHLTSNRFGQVIIPVSADLLAQNPELSGQPGTSMSFRFSLKFSGQKVDEVIVRTTTEMNRQGNSHTVVYYDSHAKALADRVLRELERERKELRRLLGFEPVSWATLIDPEDQKKNTLYLTVPAPDCHNTWTWFGNQWRDGTVKRVNVHEWAESTLTERFPSLYDDPRNRFIGDGLAEWMSWKISGIDPSYVPSISSEVVSKETINLLDAFHVVPGGKVLSRRKLITGLEKHGYAPGYAISFVFWHQLTAKHGEDLPARYLSALAKTNETISNEIAIAVLEEITGDSNLQEALKNTNVAHARQIIEDLSKDL